MACSTFLSLFSITFSVFFVLHARLNWLAVSFGQMYYIVPYRHLVQDGPKMGLLPAYLCLLVYVHVLRKIDFLQKQNVPHHM